MEMKRCVALIAMGVGGTLLYQQMMNGNVKKMMRDISKSMKRITMDTCDDLEDMM